MAKAKTAMSPTEFGLKKMLEGDITGYEVISDEGKRHLKALVGTLIGSERGDDQIEHLFFLVNLWNSGQANKSSYYPKLKALKRAIKKEIAAAKA